MPDPGHRRGEPDEKGERRPNRTQQLARVVGQFVATLFGGDTPHDESGPALKKAKNANQMTISSGQGAETKKSSNPPPERRREQ